MAKLRGSGGRVEGLKTEVVNGAGERVPVLLSASLIYDGEAPIGSVGIFTDLREKMHMERKLQQAQDQILAQERQAIVAELAGAAAHELNQPLTSVMAYTELLIRKLEPTKDSPADASTWSAAQVIFTQAERMAEIVRKIGKITRYETKSYVGRARILDLDKAAPDSGEGGAQPSPEHGAHLEEPASGAVRAGGPRSDIPRTP
jgi:signal transduction histidine kinase